MSYKERQQHLGLMTLAYRRMRGDMVEVFKIMNNKYDPVVSRLLTKHFNVVQTRPSRGTSKKLCKKKKPDWIL